MECGDARAADQRSRGHEEVIAYHKGDMHAAIGALLEGSRLAIWRGAR